MTALERGHQMMLIPMGQLPPLAMEFARKLSREVGWCGEVALTAWTVYAQVVEGLPNDDDLYEASQSDRDWFRERMP